MKISIALATYNGEEYLEKQLNSYIKQERQPDELIVCDDMSSDKTIAIIKNFEKIAPFEVKIFINKSNLGYTENFEKALSLSSGDIVFFSDQDDIWFSNKISIVEKTFIENPTVFLVIHDGELVNEELIPTGVTKLGQILSGGYTENAFISGTLTAIRRELIDIVLPFPNGVAGGHDGWVHTMAKLTNKRIIIKDVLQQLRRHSKNTSEWVVSSTKKINKLDVLKSQFLTIAAESYADRLFLNKSLQERFISIKVGSIKCKFDINFVNIKKILDNEYGALVKRQELLSYSFFGKKLKAIDILINGEYNYFNGIKSFIRDFLR